MTLSPEQFREYFRKHKIANAAIVESYMVEVVRSEYHYEDIDAVYQRWVDFVTSVKEVNSAGRRHNGIAGGGTCTLSGLQYGNHYS